MSENEMRTTAEDISSAIREQISGGRLVPDSRVTEHALAEEFGTSRTPAREAMRLLAAEGFLIFKPNSGSFVRSWSLKEIDEIFSLRLIVESELAAKAALHISHEELSKLQNVQRALEDLGERLDEKGVSHASRLNQEFHLIITKASQNPRLAKMLSDAIKVPIIQSTFSRYQSRELLRSHHHHRELIDALRVHDDVWAKAIMQCHISSAREVMTRTQRDI